MAALSRNSSLVAHDSLTSLVKEACRLTPGKDRKGIRIASRLAQIAVTSNLAKKKKTHYREVCWHLYVY
jgi:hypothetical protein